MTEIIVTRNARGMFVATGTAPNGNLVVKYQANRAQGIADVLEQYHAGASVQWRVEQDR